MMILVQIVVQMRKIKRRKVTKKMLKRRIRNLAGKSVHENVSNLYLINNFFILVLIVPDLLRLRIINVNLLMMFSLVQVRKKLNWIFQTIFQDQSK